jgi:hypothetical protein
MRPRWANDRLFGLSRELDIIDVVDLEDKKVPEVHYDVLVFEVAIWFMTCRKS